MKLLKSLESKLRGQYQYYINKSCGMLFCHSFECLLSEIGQVDLELVSEI